MKKFISNLKTALILGAIIVGTIGLFVLGFWLDHLRFTI